MKYQTNGSDIVNNGFRPQAVSKASPKRASPGGLQGVSEGCPRGSLLVNSHASGCQCCSVGDAGSADGGVAASATMMQRRVAAQASGPQFGVHASSAAASRSADKVASAPRSIMRTSAAISRSLSRDLENERYPTICCHFAVFCLNLVSFRCVLQRFRGRFAAFCMNLVSFCCILQ